MPTPYELELLEMSRRANAEEAPKGPQLPDLDPNMFLSHMGAFELHAAQILEPVPNLVDDRVRRTQEALFRETDRTVMAGRTAATSRPSLEALFMASAARETGMDMVDALSLAFQATAPTEDFDISYDGDLDTIGGARGVPNEAVRFQIGRQSPPPINFSSDRQMLDGQVVASRMNGRFQVVVPRNLTPILHEESTPVPRFAYEPHTPVSTVQQSRYEAPAPSALDIISGDSFDNL